MNPAKPEDPTLIHVLDTSACFSRFALIICLIINLEHIKYPESNKMPQQNVPSGTNNTRKSSVTTTTPQPPRPTGSSPTHGHSMSSSVINGMRAMSPNGAQSPDPEELRRAISPTGQQKPQANGISQGPFSSKDKGKNPVRPRREDDDHGGADSGAEAGPTAPERPERAVSPEQRARSPYNQTTRAMSPGGQHNGDEASGTLSMATVAAMTASSNGSVTRSLSPVVDRSKSSADQYYGGKSDSPVNGLVNGYMNGSQTSGADSLALDSMQKREAWLKAALVRASRSGFVYADLQETPEDLVLDFSASGDQGESKRVVEMVMNLKHMRATIQVSLIKATLIVC
jgi:hypothetical protein